MSSTNAAWAVVSGLMGTYGTMLCFHHMIVTNPQRDAARIIKVAGRRDLDTSHTNLDNVTGPLHASAPAKLDVAPGTKSRCGEQVEESSPTKLRPSGKFEDSGHFDYVWQRFPSEAPFLDRLGWAADLVLSFRGAGWSHSISVLPRPQKPTVVKDGMAVDAASVPFISRCGYEYIHPPSTFVWHRLRLFAAVYLILDFLGTFMMKDPYFVFGRDESIKYPLPGYLASLSSWRLEAYRQLFSISGAWAAVTAGYSLADVVSHWLSLKFWPSRDIPWIYASAFGSFADVFERGLAGFWGSWWHQTFRQCFMSPATLLFNLGLIQKGTMTGSLVTLITSFAASALLHSMGSLSAMPRTKLWSQPVFFLLQALGIVVQQQLGSIARSLLPNSNVIMRRTGNALFTLLWLYATAGFFNDDMAVMGIWLLEPVPFSFARAMGFGFPDDAAWRWDSRHFVFRWHSGSHWWSSGLTIGV